MADRFYRPASTWLTNISISENGLATGRIQPLCWKEKASGIWQLCSYICGESLPEQILLLISEIMFRTGWHPNEFPGSGYVQPFCDSPLDDEIVGENVYLNIINRAKNYVYICTPYLIIDNEMMTALCLAAKSGVDVRIMTPGIPDKKWSSCWHSLIISSFWKQV